MRIAVLGPGRMGRTLGAGLIDAGHGVVFGSRHAGRATGLPAPLLGHVEAIAGSDVVVATARAVEHCFLRFAALMGALRTPVFDIAITR